MVSMNATSKIMYIGILLFIESFIYCMDVYDYLLCAYCTWQCAKHWGEKGGLDALTVRC